MIYALVVRVVVQKQLFMSFSETCRTPRECRIEMVHGARGYIIPHHLSGMWHLKC